MSLNVKGKKRETLICGPTKCQDLNKYVHCTTYSTVDPLKVGFFLRFKSQQMRCII